MRVITDLSEVLKIKNNEKQLGFVPTMGYLHEGHLSIVKRAISENDETIVSIYVNPTQFGENEDLDNYPRSIESDLEKLEQAGVDYVYIPKSSEIYPEGFATNIIMPELTKDLCGISRPTHFNGVCIIVLKLCNIIKPNNLYLGKKDYQQLLIIQQLFKDLNVQIKVTGCEIVRDNEGLALSSRNKYLNPEELEVARKLNKILKNEAQLITKDWQNLSASEERIKMEISELGLKVDYVALRTERLRPVTTTICPSKVIILIAVYVGQARLLDNIEIEGE